MTHNWKYIKSGGVGAEKIIAVLCEGDFERVKYRNFNLAMHCETDLKHRGTEFSNSIADFIIESKNILEDSWKGKKSYYKTPIIKLRDWNSMQKKLKEENDNQRRR